LESKLAMVSIWIVFTLNHFSVIDEGCACHRLARDEESAQIPMTTAEELSNFMKHPRPFSIHLADGREIVGPHGEFLYVNPNTGRFVVETAEVWEAFNLSMVTSIKRAKQKR